MAVMRVDHPDILEFIHCKEKEGSINNFNVSVGLTNEFMEKVRDNDPNAYMCKWNGQDMKPRRIKRDHNYIIESIEEVDMTAKEIFQEVISSAWSNGEPGCVFLDTVNETNPLPGLGRIEACNPCGEQFLHDGDVCNLGSINLEKFVKNNEVDYEKLQYVTKIAVIMLDNVIDISSFPSEKVNKTSKENRRIGLGIMGFADMLYQLKVPYDSEEGLKIAENVMGSIQETAHQTSMELAEEKESFPNWDKSIYAEKGVKMRNAALTNIAPTGTIAMMFDVSGGVEPYFALAYHYKAILGGKISLSYINKHLENALKEEGVHSDDIMEKIVKEGSLKNIEGITEKLKKVFVTSMDISAEDHINMQASFQKHCDNAISKTINFPNEATKEDVLDGYLLAWKLGCKGCTAYRDGSRELQILNLNKDKKDEGKKEKKNLIEKSDYYEINTGQGPLHLHINYDDLGLTKLFANIAPVGTEISGLTTTVGILISKYLEVGGDPLKLIKHLNSIKGDKPLGFGPNRVDSIPHGISKVMRKHLTKIGVLQDLEGQTMLNNQSTFDKGEFVNPENKLKLHCSKCFSNNVAMVSGCKEPTCFDCGYSACG
jgi:ribonucleoside-diphosphate reductase alpha chain